MSLPGGERIGSSWWPWRDADVLVVSWLACWLRVVALRCCRFSILHRLSSVSGSLTWRSGMSASYTLPASWTRPNAARRCYAPRWFARRQDSRRLALSVKLLCGRFPHHHPPTRRECCLGVKACGEANAATAACSLCSWRWCYAWGCASRGVENGAPTVGLVQHVGWLDPVGRHGDRLAVHKELQCFLSPREDLVGAAVRGLQSLACCALTEKDMRAVMEVLVHECGRGGVVRCRNWSEAGHMTAQLCDEMHWDRCRGQ
jgi:hypothetical protein